MEMLEVSVATEERLYLTQCEAWAVAEQQALQFVHELQGSCSQHEMRQLKSMHRPPQVNASPPSGRPSIHS